MTEIRAIRVEDIDEPGGEMPGAYEIRYFGNWAPGREGQPAGMAFRCPCGCGSQAWLPFRPSETSGPSWEFNGDADSPVLSPSVLFRGGCRWHGWLGGSDGQRPGVWVSC